MKSKRLGIWGSLLIAVAVLNTTIFAAEIQTGVMTKQSIAYEVPDTTGERVGYLLEGESFNIVEETDDFYGVLIEDDELVYVEKIDMQVEQENSQEEQVVAEEVIIEEKAAEEKVVPEKTIQEEVKLSKGEEVVNYAKNFIGTPYRSGGNSLTKGVDCSGFTQQVFLKFDVKLQRSSRSQFASNGKKVVKNELQAGDLVFYGYNGRVNHVAIYIGNSQIIHAPVPGKTVCIEPLWQRGCAPIIGYKRIV